MGRKGCDTVVTVLKVTPYADGNYVINVVNIFTFSDMHFEDQAINLKRLFYKYKAQRLVIDANGMGIGLVDYMVKPQIDRETNEAFPDYGVYNDEEQYYKKYKTSETELEAMYIMKANAPINTEAHANVRSLLASNKIQLLIDDRVAKNKLMTTKVGQNMTPEQRADYLRPFVSTSALQEELMNLREVNEGVNIILKQANRGIPKDKFSSLEYGLYYIKQEEERRRKRKAKKFNAKDWLFLN